MSSMSSSSPLAPSPVHGPSRTRLPQLRDGITKKIEFGSKASQDIYITVNFFEANAGADDVEARCRPAEVFVKIGRTGDVVTGLIEGLSLTLSVALQYGVPWDVISAKYLDTKFGDSDEKHSSLLDAIAQTINGIIKVRRSIIGD